MPPALSPQNHESLKPRVACADAAVALHATSAVTASARKARIRVLDAGKFMIGRTNRTRACRPGSRPDRPEGPAGDLFGTPEVPYIRLSPPDPRLTVENGVHPARRARVSDSGVWDRVRPPDPGRPPAPSRRPADPRAG